MASSHAMDLNDARDHLPNLIMHATGGDEVIITREGEPVAMLVPLARRRVRRKAGSMAGMIALAPDFDEPLEDFRDYV